MTKPIVIFAVALIALQVKAASYDEAKKDLDETVQIVNKASDNALITLLQLPVVLQNVTQDTLTVGRARVIAARDRIQNQLNQLKDLVGNNPDFNICFEDDVTMQDFLDGTPSMFERCVWNWDNTALTGVSQSLGAISQHIQKVYDLEVSLNKCGNDATCLDAISTTAIFYQTQIPLDIAKEQNNAVNNINLDIEMLRQCEPSITAQIDLRGAEYVEYVQSCIEEHSH